jgi:hypothetical protein
MALRDQRDSFVNIVPEFSQVGTRHRSSTPLLSGREELHPVHSLFVCDSLRPLHFCVKTFLSQFQGGLSPSYCLSSDGRRMIDKPIAILLQPGT